MKFAMRDPRMTELLASHDMEQWSLAAFFFHDRGSEKQKTLNGMLQELLRSILQQIPTLSRYVFSSYIELVRAQRTRCPSWDFSSLKSALVSLFEQRHVKIRILLLLDALDEHQGDNDLLASLLKSLVDKSDNKWVNIKMCLASRSWTVFQQHFGNCPGFSIHDHTREDITTYIRARLEPCGPQEMDQLGHESITPLADLVAARALGVFIWVRLVVDMLAKGIQDGTPHRTLEEKVNKIPRELRDLYADTLRRIEPEYTSEAFIMLHTALCSFELLPLKVFMAISDINVAYCDDLIIPSVNMEQPTSSHKSRLASRSGGLLEVVQRDQSVPESDGLVVQFIHQTVKEYMQSASKTLGLSQIPSKILQENGYKFLLRMCANCHSELVACIKKDVFEYARCAAKKGKENFGAYDSECWEFVSLIVKYVRQSLMLNPSGPIDFKWFLAKQRGSFFTDLLSEVKANEGNSKAIEAKEWGFNSEFHMGFNSEFKIDSSVRKVAGGMVDGERVVKGLGYDWETLLAKLAVAMNFPEYFQYYPGVSQAVRISRGLLHVAVAAPHLGTGIRDADHEYMIRVLVGIGCDINERDGWMLKHINTNQVIDEPKGVSPLVQTLIDKDGSEEVRLRITKTLLDLGASADMDNSVVLDGSVRIHFNPLQYCVCYESAAFVRLLLQYWTYPTKYDAGFLRMARIRQDADLIQTLLDLGMRDDAAFLRMARIRQDADLIQTLLDFGMRDGDGKDASSDFMPVGAAIMMHSHVVAAPSGGLSTVLFRDSRIERLRQGTENSSRGVANNSSSTNVQ